MERDEQSRRMREASESLTAEKVTSVHLREVADEAVALVQQAHPDHDVEVGMSIPAETMVAAGPTAMHLVLVHLLSNAVKFSPPGERVAVTARTDGDLVTVSITNLSPPLTDRQREDIFKPFIRLEGDDDVGEPSHGGIGLHLVRRYVDLYQGTVSVSSAGNLVTFTVQLPVGSMEDRVLDLRDRSADLELE
jgi:signal transduction histidine kinase